jgi:hypothetical protein
MIKKDKQYPLRMEKNVFNELQEEADKMGISINSWMNLKLKKSLREKK